MNQVALTLVDYGCTDDIRTAWQAIVAGSVQNARLARVVADFGTSLKIVLPEVQTAELSGILAHYAEPQQHPKIGDWVVVKVFDTQRAVIEAIIPRRGEIARKAAGNKTVKQVVAANVDVAFVLLALDNDFSIERLKRYMYQLAINNVEAIIVLNKADKTDNPEAYIGQLEEFLVPIIVTNALTGLGVDQLLQHVTVGQTAILLGSSGVGKSTLTNRLLNRDVQLTQAVRLSDSTGRHTTVHRELFVLPNGGLLIDTPGIRELQLWGTEEDLDDSYDDIATLSNRCSFANCKHSGESGCAIQAAIGDSSLLAARYTSYQKMKAELISLKAKNAVVAQRRNKKSAKSIRRQSEDMMDDM